MRKILCNNCYKQLCKQELSVYSLQWQFSGDMYCNKCRTCPDDCRYTPCKQVEKADKIIKNITELGKKYPKQYEVNVK